MIIFDIVGTLTTEGSFVKLLKELLPTRNRDKIKELYKKYRVDEISAQNFWSGLNVKNTNDIQSKLISKVKFREGYYDLMKNLSEKYKLGILSNMPKEWGRKIAKKGKFKKFFNPVVFSGDYKVAKPDCEIYEVVIRAIENEILTEEQVGSGKPQGNKIYYVDNELGDLEGASRFNWVTVYLDCGAGDLEESKFKPDFIIYKLDELNNILED